MKAKTDRIALEHVDIIRAAIRRATRTRSPKDWNEVSCCVYELMNHTAGGTLPFTLHEMLAFITRGMERGTNGIRHEGAAAPAQGSRTGAELSPVV